MKEFLRKILLIIILLSGTQIISLPYINLTIFQIAIIVSCIFGIIYIFHEKKIYRGNYLILTILYILSSIVAYYNSIYKSWASSYLLLGLMAAFIIFIIPNLFTRDDINLLQKTLIRSQYIVFPFSIYSIYMFYFKGGLPLNIDLPLGLKISLTDDFLKRAQASSQIRLSLPYATPPVLATIISICLIMLIINKKLFSNKNRLILIILFSTILILTGSRTGIFGLIISISLFYKNEMKVDKLKVSKHNIFIISLFIVTFAILFLVLKNTTYIQKFLLRIYRINILTDRHFLVPLDGLIIWTSSLKYFLLGIGFGSSYFMVGAHTVLPPYFLNSFVTLVAERGIMGLVIIIHLFYLLISYSKKIKKNSDDIKSNYYSYICIIISAITYEIFNSYFVIFIIAILSLIYSNNKNKCGG